MLALAHVAGRSIFHDAPSMPKRSPCNGFEQARHRRWRSAEMSVCSAYGFFKMIKYAEFLRWIMPRLKSWQAQPSILKPK